MEDKHYRYLRNLLAIIHRDGGHYVEEHGIDKAVEDAIAVWGELSVAESEAYEILRFPIPSPGRDLRLERWIEAYRERHPMDV